jgi:hypothetical protein
MKKNDCLQTPYWVYGALGDIDLDPCAGIDTKIGKINWAIERGEDGLEREWCGFTFVNPPFSEKSKWIEKSLDHMHGILLLPERGSAPWFGPLAKAAGNYFVMGKKINFIGGPSSNNLGTVLFALGDEARRRLIDTTLPGHFVEVVKFTPR